MASDNRFNLIKDKAELLYASKKYEESISEYLKLIASHPKEVDFNFNVGVLYYFTNNYSKASIYLNCALSLSNGDAHILNVALNLFLRMGDELSFLAQFEKFANIYEKNEVINRYFEQYEVLQTKLERQRIFILLESNQIKEAINLLLNVINKRKDNSWYYVALIDAYMRLSEYSNARITVLAAEEKHSENHEVLNATGFYFEKNREILNASRRYQKSIELNSNYSLPKYNLANIYSDNGDFDDAEVLYLQAIKLDPNNENFLRNIAHLYFEMAKYDLALHYIEKAIKSTLKVTKETLSTYVFILGHAIGNANIFIEKISIIHDHFDVDSLKNIELINSRKNIKRIGFVSGDFKNHSLSKFFLPIIEALFRNSKFEYVAYNNSDFNDFYTEKLRKHFHKWNDVQFVSDIEMFNLIKADEIDILIDLSGHTSKNRLSVFGMKPANIQISWMGFPGTTGLKNIDYYILDSICKEYDFLKFQFTEKLIYLNNSLQFEFSKDRSPAKKSAFQRNGFLTIGSFNRPNKLSEEFLKLCHEILSKFPTVRLMLAAMPNSKNAALHIHALIDKLGIDRSRIQFVQNKEHKEYIDLYNHVDISLDSYPYSGGTTTLHSISMGVPVLTLTGETFPSLTTANIMKRIGFEKYVCKNRNHVFEVIFRAINDSDELTKDRNEILNICSAWEKESPSRCAEELEAIFHDIKCNV